jgi:hypothetical protein
VLCVGGLLFATSRGKAASLLQGQSIHTKSKDTKTQDRPAKIRARYPLEQLMFCEYIDADGICRVVTVEGPRDSASHPHLTVSSGRKPAIGKNLFPVVSEEGLGERLGLLRWP